MLRAYKYRIYPSEQQIILIEKHFGCSRLIFNTGLQYRKYAWESGVSVGYFESNKELTSLKKEYPFLKEVNSQSLQSSLRNLDTAFVNMFKGRGGYPKFKSKFDKQSFSCPQNAFVEGKLLWLPKFNEGIEIVLHRKFRGEIKTVNISRTPTNKYFASILVETGIQLPNKPEPTRERSNGIDVGLDSFATVGNIDLTRKSKIENPKYLRKQTELLKMRQRQLAKKKKGSRNREKARLKLARKHEKIKNKNNDFLNKTSFGLVNDNQVDTNCIEDLNVKGMMKNHKLARAIGEVSWSEFFRQLKYKSDWVGKSVLEAERFSATSKDCHCCGYKNKAMPLSVREWDCPTCGTHHDRDENSVPNIIASAFEKHYKQNRDGLPESTLGESSPLSLPKTRKRKARTLNQEKYLNPVLSLAS